MCATRATKLDQEEDPSHIANGRTSDARHAGPTRASFRLVVLVLFWSRYMADIGPRIVHYMHVCTVHQVPRNVCK